MKIDKILFRDAFFCTIMTFIVAGILYFTFVNLSFLDPFENTFKDFKFTDYYYSKRFTHSAGPGEWAKVCERRARN